MIPTIRMPTGFIDPALAGATELQALRASVEAASGSFGATRDSDSGATAPVAAAAAAAEHLSQLLQPHATQPLEARLVVRGPHGEMFELLIPRAWGAGMFQELAVLLSGNVVTWRATRTDESADGAASAAGDDEVGTSDVASLLGVSIPTATKVLDRGLIPSRTTPGGHRRALREDVKAWRDKRDQQRRSLHALARMAEADEQEVRGLPADVTEDPDDES